MENEGLVEVNQADPRPTPCGRKVSEGEEKITLLI
jgi:hypothetical protein